MPSLRCALRAFREYGCAALLLFTHCKPSNAKHEAVPPVITLPAPKAALAPRRHAFELECRKLAETRCDVRDVHCQDHLFELARCLSARDGTQPPLHFVSPQESRDQRSKQLAHTSNTQAALEQALHVLGLGEEPGSINESDLGANAYYSPRVRSVFFVTDSATPYEGELAEVALVHEYIHAIQDSHGELLAALNGRGTRTFDEELTLWSAFEGEATLCEEVTRAFLHHRDPRTWLVEHFAARTDASDDALDRQRRPLEASFATFPYSYGAYWTTLENQRPVSTQQLLARRHPWPRSPVPSPMPSRCDDATSANFAPNLPRRGRNTLGAWLVQAYVRRATRDPERARSAARGWRGDWLTLYGRASDSNASGPASFVWQTCWDSPETARQMRGLLETQLSQSAPGRATVVSDGQRVTATVRPVAP